MSYATDYKCDMETEPKVNKVMSNSMLPDQMSPHLTIRLNPSECEKPKAEPTVPCRRWFFRRLRFSVVANTIISILVIILLLAVEFGLIPQRKLGFTCKDPAISYPYSRDSISVITLLMGSYLGPLVIILITEIVREKSYKNIRPGLVWDFYKECLVGGHFVLLITEIVKILVGEHRPHFFDVCQPDMNLSCVEGTYITEYTCTNKAYSQYFLTDSSRSFPSGHSSISVFVSVFSVYVLQTRLPSIMVGKIFKLFLIALCLSWCLVCSLTRITDRRHHWWDVLSGVVLGLLTVSFFLVLIHQKLQRNFQQSSATSISSTMLLDVKNKDSDSVRV